MSQAARRSAGPVAIGHHVGGKPRPGESGRASDVFNPATGELTGLGEDILLVVELRVLFDQIKCKIIWRKPSGMGVAFDTSDPGYSELKTLLAARCFS